MAAKTTNEQIEAIKDFLKNYNYYTNLIRSYKNLLLKTDSGIAAINYDREKVQSTNKFYSSVENEIIKKEDIRQRLKATEDYKMLIDMSIDLLEDKKRHIIKLYYIENMMWEYIAQRTNYTREYCIELRSNAVVDMQVSIYSEAYDKQSNTSQLAFSFMKVKN